jgi:hypothetical protein
MLPHAVGHVKPQVSDLYTAVVLRWYCGGTAWSRRAHVTCGNGRYQIVMSDSRRRPRSAIELETIHGRLAELEGRCPPGHRAAVFDALDAIEAEVVTLGWSCPDPPLTAHDLEVLRSLGCPA